MFVALLAGLIFNAQGLLATARQLPYGSTTRSVSITLLRPVNDVTNALFLNSPARRPPVGAGTPLAGHLG